MESKICYKCKIDKLISSFYKCKLNKDGLQNLCKACKKIETGKYHLDKQKDICNLKTARDQFESLFLDQSEFRFKKMEWNCKFPYVMSICEDVDKWVPVTIRTCNYESRYAYLCLPDKGIVICWKSSDEITYFACNNWTVNRTTFNKIAKLAIDTTTTTLLLNSIREYVLKSEIEYPIIKIKNSLTIEKSKHDTMSLESKFTEFMMTKSENNIHKCPEGCLADIYYTDDKNNDNVLPIQLKSSEYTTKSGCFNIKSGGNYSNMIVMLRHLTANRGTFIIPGNILPKTCICGTWDGKYSKYLVQDDVIVDLLKKLYEAICEGKEQCQLPNDTLINIKNIKLMNKINIMIPVTKLHKLEREYSLHRIDKFPNITHKFPLTNGSVVDVILNDVNIQDKIATSGPNDSFHLCLSKSFGRKKKQPYDHDDFDALFIHMPDKVGFYLIPSCVLLEYKYLRSAESQGKQTLGWYPNQKTRSSNNFWIQNYLYDYDTPNIEGIIIEKLKKI